MISQIFAKINFCWIFLMQWSIFKVERISELIIDEALASSVGRKYTIQVL